MAFAALFILQLFSLQTSNMFGVMLYYFAQINIILAAFNLIPIPPLDGSKILMGFASPKLQASLLRFERYGFIIVIVLLFTGILEPIIRFLQRLIISAIGLLLS
jgi:Zn-dependent protease